jgi:hypothetical protein
MTQQRPYRAGLGLPTAITIRSDPAPSTRQRELFEKAQQGISEREWVHVPDQGQIWAEWNINPAKHGPERLTKVPVFVKGTGSYDELGRSAFEGSGVQVDQGKRKRERLEGEQDLGEWYRGIAASGKVEQCLEDLQEERETVKKPTDVIDLSQDDDIPKSTITQEGGLVESKPTLNDEALLSNQSKLPELSVPTKRLRVNQSEWFIRRALLAQDRSTTSSAASSPGPSSISSMLNIGSSQPRPVAFQYVLGPDNKGYELLQTRHGWEGGGLGKPADWEEQERQSAPEAGPSRPRNRSSTIELDVNGEEVVDLTIDSEEDEDAAPPVQQGGPGRTAPIATSLKLDRLGLGHQRNKKAARDAEAKVTHTIDEIRRVQQRSRYPPPKQGLELGKKGKIRWKERDKKEREERKRLLAVLNS